MHRITFSLRGQSNQSGTIIDGADRGPGRGPNVLRDELSGELKKIALKDREMELGGRTFKTLKGPEAAQFERDPVFFKKAPYPQFTELHADDFVPLLGEPQEIETFPAQRDKNGEGFTFRKILNESWLHFALVPSRFAALPTTDPEFRFHLRMGILRGKGGRSMQRISKYRWIWVFAAAACGGIMLSIPQEGRILDLRFWYSGQDALDYLQSLQGEARDRYQIHEWLDLIFMGFYSLAMAGFWRGPKRSLFVPWVAGILDFIETALILVLLIKPTWSGELEVTLASGIATVTPIKYIFFYSTLFWILSTRFRSDDRKS
jgi:hypothetical protein